VRILITAHTFYPQANGVARVAHYMAQAFVGEGHEVHVATGFVSGSSISEQTADGIHVHRFKLRGTHLTGIKGEVEKYIGFVQSRPWDVVIVHCAQVWSSALITGLSFPENCSKIFFSHGLSAYPSTPDHPYFLSLARDLRSFDQIVALSHRMEEPQFCERFGLHPPRIIPNPVDLDEFAADPLDMRTAWNIGSNPWLLSVSNHAPVKGHETMRVLMANLSRQIPATRGSIIGDSHPAEKWNLGRLGVQGGCWYSCQLAALLDRRVQLHSSVSRQQVVSAIKQADILVMTSNREAAPLALLEAMAAGTPWVSFRVGCVDEYKGGIVVESLSAMVEAAQAILGNSTLKERLGREGRQAAREKHDLKRIAAQYRSFADNVMTRRTF
jgi:glycosyltransferase involved in cell wall biosynthesis